MKMADHLRKYIESNGMRYNFVAEKAGIQPKRFYRLINGHTQISVEEYEMICKHGLSLDPGYFFNQNFLESKN